MKMTKAERQRAIAMMNGWCEYYLETVKSYNRLCKEFTHVAKDNHFQEIDPKLVKNIEWLEEVVRDMSILLRTREILRKTLLQKRPNIRVDRLITRFFQTRACFSSKMDSAAAAFRHIVRFLEQGNL